MELTIFFGWLIASIVNGFIAAERGRNATTAVLLSLVISPLIVWGYLVATPTRDR